MSLDFYGITIKHGRNTSLDKIDIKISTTPGITGVIGPNGSGKTTLIETALGLRPIFSGKISYDGSYISYCQDTPEFGAGLKAEEIVKESALQAGIYLERSQIKAVLDEVGLTEVYDKYANTFSRGMKQRLGIATCLVLSPQVLFLDEPTSALDPFGRNDLLQLILSLSVKMRIIVSTHLLEDVGEVADDIIVLNKGKLVFSGTKSNFLSSYHLNEWEILCETGENLDVVSKFMLNKNVSFDYIPSSDLGLIVTYNDLPFVLTSLSNGPLERVSGIRPRRNKMYGAFEMAVGDNKSD